MLANVAHGFITKRFGVVYNPPRRTDTSPATGTPVAPLHRFDWVSASPCCTRLTWWAELPGRVATSLEFAPVSIRRKLEAQSRPHAKRRSALILDRASANWLMSYFVHIKERYLRNEKFNENKE